MATVDLSRLVSGFKNFDHVVEFCTCFRQLSVLLPIQRYGSVVLAVIMRLSVCLSCLSQVSVLLRRLT